MTQEIDSNIPIIVVSGQRNKRYNSCIFNTSVIGTTNLENEVEFLEDLNKTYHMSVPANNDTNAAGSGDNKVSNNWPLHHSYNPGNHTIQLMVRSNCCSRAMHDNDHGIIIILCDIIIISTMTLYH